MILYNPTVSGSLLVTGSLTTTGTITSQTLVVQTITSSIEFNTGSTRNGTLSTNTHEFTGSVGITGSAAALLSVNNGVLYVSASGNVGIGTTSPSQLLEVVGGEIKAGRVDSSNEGGQVSFGRSTDNATSWYIDNYGNAASTQLRFVNVADSLVAMTITGSRVGIGTSSPGTQFMVSNNSTSVTTTYIENNAAGYGLAVTTSGNDGTHYIANFRSTGVDRMQILDNGRVLIGGNVWSTERFGVVLDSSQASATGITAYTVNTGYNGSLIRVQAETTGGTGWYGYELRASGGILKYGIYGNGTVTAPSDERRKKNIETTRDGYLQDICNLRVVKYNWNEDEEGKDKELGFVAQEVEQIFPKLVETGYDGLNNENEVKLLKQGVLIPILVKAIQEQQAKITALEEILQRNNIQ
jgi:hypothetical protein